jgi:hypothetical protein
VVPMVIPKSPRLQKLVPSISEGLEAPKATSDPVTQPLASKSPIPAASITRKPSSALASRLGGIKVDNNHDSFLKTGNPRIA